MSVESASQRKRTLLADRREWIAVGLITLLAAFLRIYLLRLVPPGVHFDEAVYGLQGEIIYRGNFPIFFSSYTGREPFYMYLVALVYLFTGPNTYGLRLTSALIGTATIPVAYLAFREMFGRRVALLGAVLTAIGYWHFNVTRTGFCWTLMPLVEALAVYLLWRGYRDGKRFLLVLGGAATGSAMYIYLAARFFPPTVACIAVYLLLVDRQRFVARWRGVLLAAVAAIAVFAPLGVYYLQHPQDFWERANQVGVWAKAGSQGVLGIIAENVYQIGITYLPHWNLHTRYSLQGRPIFDVLIGPFFLLGVALALWKWRKPEHGVLVLWWVVMSLPPVFTAEQMPVGQRMFGAIPAIYGIAALGMDGVLRWAGRRREWQKAALAAVGIILAAEAVWAAVHYFTVWAVAPGTYHGFHSSYVEIGRLVGPEMDAGHRVVIASEHYRHPSTVLTEPRAVDAKWVVGKRLVVLPAWDGREVDYFVPVAHANPISPALQVLERAACSKEEFVSPVGDVGVVLYRICRPPAAEAPSGAVAVFADEVALREASVPAEARRDEPLRVAIRWDVLKPAAGPRDFAVHLVDAQGVRWAQTDEAGHLAGEWQVGDRVWQWLEVPLEPSVPPGTYEVRLILSGENAHPLPVRDAEGKMAGIYITVGHVRLTDEPRWVQPPKSGAPLIGPMRVWGWIPVGAERRPGEDILAEVAWQAAGAASDALAAVLELRTGTGQTVARWEYPLAAEYPAARWQVGEVVRQRYLLRIPPDFPAGQYALHVGVAGYAEAVRLGTVRVQSLPRLMTPPPIQHPFPTPIVLGDKVELLGYDLEKDTWGAGEPIRLTLYWRALASMDVGYKVFVHVLDWQGQVVAQRDVAPADWSRPTTGWTAGEVVIDAHELPPLGAGEYRIAVGMYHPETFARLEMRGPSGERVPDDRLILGEVRVR